MKKILYSRFVSFVLIALMSINMFTPVFASGSGTDAVFIDECDDLSKVDSATADMTTYTTDTQKMYNSDPVRLGRATSARTNGMIQHVIYKVTGNMKSFEVIGLFNKIQDMYDFTFYVSKDGKSFSEITVNKSPNEGPSWDYVIYTFDSFDADYSYLKIQINGEITDRNWDGQISRVVINYKSTIDMAGLAVYAPEYKDPAPSDVIDKDYTEAVRTLLGLGILNKVEGDAFKADEGMTRDEFVSACVRILGLNPLAKDTQPSLLASECINILKGMGVYPDDATSLSTINYEEAVKILVNILGYDATISGTKSNGAYISAAARIRLLEGVSGSEGKAISRVNAAKMLFNALDIDVVEKTSYGAVNNYEVVKDLNLLNSNLRIYTDTGVVFATHATALTNDVSGVKSDTVQIDNTKFKYLDSSIVSLLGYRVQYYYTQDSKTNIKTVVYAQPEEGVNEILEVIDENIDPETTKTKLIYYTDDSKKEKKASISSTADMIYNGKAISFDVNKMLLPDSKVRLLDNDADGRYDVVFVSHYKNIAAERLSEKYNTIHSKYTSNPSMLLDPVDGDDEYFISKDGQSVEIGVIKEWDILSVEQSVGSDGKSYTRVWVSDKNVQGQITSITDEDADSYPEKIVIDETEYKVADSYITAIKANKAPNLAMANEGTFYLDILGRVAAYSQVETEEGYAYLKEAYPDDTTNRPVLRMFTQNSEWITAKVEDYIYINDEKTKKDDVIKELEISPGVTNQLIKYKINAENVIRKIYTVTDEADFTINTSTTYKEYAETNDIFRKSKTIKQAKFNGNNMSLYEASSQFLKAPTYVSNETIMFSIPETSSDIEDESRYDIRTVSSYFKDGDTYSNVDMYDEDKFAHAAVIVLKDGFKKTISAKDKVYVVKKMVSSVNESGDTCFKLTLYDAGAEKDFFTLDDTQIIKISKSNTNSLPEKDYTLLQKNDLAEGDIVQISVDAKNNVRVIYQWADASKLIDNPSFAEGFTSNASPGGQLGILYGTVYDFNTNRSFMNIDNGSILPFSFKGTVNYYIVSFRDGVPIDMSSRNAIDINTGDKIIVHFNWMAAKNVVVIRNS